MHDPDQVTRLSLSQAFGSDGRHYKGRGRMLASLFNAWHGVFGGPKSRSRLSIIQHFTAVCLVSANNVNAVPVVDAVKENHQLLRNINTPLSFDPVSLITLFFDAAEKHLMERSGDLTFLSCFGLFVNPTTAWSEYEYGTLYPGEGLRYYVPDILLTSTVEVAQVNKFLIGLTSGLRDCGIILKLDNSSTTSLWEWKFRPVLPVILVVLAGVSRDLWAIGAIVCLFGGQATVIARSIYDSKKQKLNRWRDTPSTGSSKQRQGSDPDAHPTDVNVATLPQAGDATDESEHNTVLFLANNVTVLVKCKGRLFVKAVAAIYFEKAEKPIALEVLTTLVFMAGVLMVGFAGINFKIAYLVGHALQSVLISLGKTSKFDARRVNGVTWCIDGEQKKLSRRREAYLWATEHTGGNVDWLTKFSLAPDTLVSEIRSTLEQTKNQNAKTPQS